MEEETIWMNQAMIKFSDDEDDSDKDMERGGSEERINLVEIIWRCSRSG